MSAVVRPHADGAVLAVRAVPGASAAKVVGLQGDELRVRVCSPPIDGRANAEVTELVARALGLRARDVQLVGGHASRSKLLLVPLAPAEVTVRLGPWISPERTADR